MADPGPECGGGADLKDYSVRWHVAAVGVMLAVSLLGSLLPVALHLSSSRPGVTTGIRLGTYFGFGTILATAFIHMLGPAAEALSSPCLPAAFRDAYDAWAFLFCFAAVLLMHLIDYSIKGHYRFRAAQQQQQQLEELLQQQQQQQQQQQDHLSPQQQPQQPASAIASPAAHLQPGSGMGSPVAHLHHHGSGCAASHVAIIGALIAKEQHAEEQDEEAAAGEAAAAAELGEASSSGSDGEEACHVSGDLCTPLLPQRGKRRRRGGAARDASAVVGIYLTEAGIIFHSVMIGLTLGVASGPPFKTLLMALSLHQLFEGFAIGSAAVDSGLGAARSAALGLAFSVTTPIGIVAGILLRESVSRSAALALLASGLFDALSAGVLIYVCLVELLTPMFTDSQWLRSQRWAVQAAAFASLYSGAAVMALLGKWA